MKEKLIMNDYILYILPTKCRKEHSVSSKKYIHLIDNISVLVLISLSNILNLNILSIYDPFMLFLIVE